MSATSTRQSGTPRAGTSTGWDGSAAMSCSSVAAAPSHSDRPNRWPVSGAESGERSHWSTRSSAARCAWERMDRSTLSWWARARRLTGSSAKSRLAATAFDSGSQSRNRESTRATMGWSAGADGAASGACAAAAGAGGGVAGPAAGACCPAAGSAAAGCASAGAPGAWAGAGCGAVVCGAAGCAATGCGAAAGAATGWAAAGWAVAGWGAATGAASG